MYFLVSEFHQLIIFDSIEQCDDVYQYVLYSKKILNINIEIGDKCHKGRGFKSSFSKELKFLLKKFELIQIIKKFATIDTCLFCGENKKLFYLCNNDLCRKSVCLLCKNNYKNSLIDAGRKLVCPYCTNEINII